MGTVDTFDGARVLPAGHQLRHEHDTVVRGLCGSPRGDIDGRLLYVHSAWS